MKVRTTLIYPLEIPMPLITVELFEGRSVEQKRQIVAGLTQTMCDITGGNPSAVQVMIRDVFCIFLYDVGLRMLINTFFVTPGTWDPFLWLDYGLMILMVVVGLMMETMVQTPMVVVMIATMDRDIDDNDDDDEMR